MENERLSFPFTSPRYREIREAAARFAAWADDPNRPDPRTHPNDPDGSRAEAARIGALASMRDRERGVRHPRARRP